jgi:hypothetical protein
MAILSFLIILKYEKDMGSFKLIRSSSMRNLRGGETAHVITLIVNLLAKIAEGELEEPVEEDRPQVQMVDFNDGSSSCVGGIGWKIAGSLCAATFCHFAIKRQ